MVTFGVKVRTELPTISISIFLFLTLWSFFGRYNVILPPFLTLFFKIKHLQDFRPNELIRNYILFLFIALMSFLAGQTLFLCIALNLFVPFFIVYFLTNKFTPKSYFVYGMAFVFMQLMPIPLSALPTRIGALLYSFGVITIGLHLYSKYVRKKRVYEKLRGKFLLLPQQLRKLLLGEDISVERVEIMKTIPAMNQLIYSTRNSKYLTTEYGKILYWFMMIFQRFNYLVAPYGEGKEISKNDREYFSKLAELLQKVGEEMNLEGNREIIMEIDRFQKLKNESSLKLEEGIGEILSLLKLALSHMKKKDYHRHEREWKIPKDEKKIKNLHRIFQLDIFHVRFALRLSVVLCVTFTFTYMSGLDHAYWFPMSSFLMLMPYAEESKMKITNRALGTVFGIVVCWILISLHQTYLYRIFIIVVMTVLMYTAPITSWTMTMYTTCYGMTLATMTLGLESATIMRFSYVGMAVIITWIANHYIFPNTAKREFKNSIRELFEIDRKMSEEVKRSYSNRGDINKFRHLLMEMNMLVNDMKGYIGRSLPERERNFFNQMLEVNQTLTVEMEQLNSYFYYGKNIDRVREGNFFEEIFENLEDVLKRVYLSYTSDELVSFMNTENRDEIFGKLKEELYFNSIVLNCIKSVKELERLHKNSKGVQ